MYFIFFLILISFLQTTLLPLNLVLLILISRSFIVSEKQNLWLAFWFGLLVSFLSGFPLGSLSIIYLFIVALVQSIKKAQFVSHWVFILPLSFILLLFDHLVRNLVIGASFNFIPVIIQTALALPVYLLVRLYEERFIPKAGIRLKVGK